MSIKDGEFVAIMGPSGSGKSTLMHILGALDIPTSGEYFLDGQDVSTLSEDELADIRKDKIGFVFQSFNLLQRTTVLENVMLPLTYSKIPVHQHEKLALDVIKQVGLDHRLNNKSNELSGGERQRVAIARALVNNPSLILADEPTGNLDREKEEEIMKIFNDLAHNQNKCIIIVTHSKSIALSSDAVFQLKNEKV